MATCPVAAQAEVDLVGIFGYYALTLTWIKAFEVSVPSIPNLAQKHEV
ncbi:MAG: hypothetical protein ACLPTZ_18645 [Beijerinckiaceae bacterium]